LKRAFGLGGKGKQVVTKADVGRKKQERRTEQSSSKVEKKGLWGHYHGLIDGNRVALFIQGGNARPKNDLFPQGEKKGLV